VSAYESKYDNRSLRVRDWSLRHLKDYARIMYLDRLWFREKKCPGWKTEPENGKVILAELERRGFEWDDGKRRYRRIRREAQCLN